MLASLEAVAVLVLVNEPVLTWLLLTVGVMIPETLRVRRHRWSLSSLDVFPFVRPGLLHSARLQVVVVAQVVSAELDVWVWDVLKNLPAELVLAPQETWCF